ncbi:hypothetical protein OG535_22995 [Kitasatospora sp. NBC_00085]|uniref:hypothetical protein n=1 Tax=unclassified Kitasatospora TaxID=2633591 RepID=UPI00324D9A22
MARTSPPRPADIVAAFPELAPLAREAVRLHPRRGEPTVRDSSVGGPLLWPADEPWPVCEREHEDDHGLPVSPSDVRLERRILGEARKRPRRPGVDFLTPEERAALDRAGESHPWSTAPNAMLPVAQLYARDVPGVPCPDGADLLQVLWCPLDGHGEDMPVVHLVWRSSADVRVVLTDPPEPADVESHGGTVPEPCVLHPEVVTEYPAPLELDRELRSRLRQWGETSGRPGGGDPACYQSDLSVAPGWKVGGWGPWSFRDPWAMTCGACGAAMTPLLTISSGDSDGTWAPPEEQGVPADAEARRDIDDPVMVQIGRGYNLQLYFCPTSFDHPHLEVMQ